MRSNTLRITVWLALIVFTVSNSFALERDIKADRVKGQVIFSMIKYIQWPETKDQLVIGVLTDDIELVKLFQEIAQDRSTAGKKIEIKAFGSMIDAVKSADMLFVPTESSSKFESVSALISHDVLVITEKEGLCKKGSSINLITVDGKLKFEINRNALQKSALKVSSKLTDMGIEV